MKKGILLNSELSGRVASPGHGKTVTIVDAGIPIPPVIHCIDQVLTAGVQGFPEAPDAPLSNMQEESLIIAEEMATSSPGPYRALMSRLSQLTADQWHPVLNVSHDAFKIASQEAIAIIRTAELTPFFNIILKSGVAF